MGSHCKGVQLRVIKGRAFFKASRHYARHTHHEPRPCGQTVCTTGLLTHLQSVGLPAIPQRYAVMLTNTAKRPPQFEFDPEAALRHVEAGVFPNVVTTPTPGPDITFMHGSECGRHTMDLTNQLCRVPWAAQASSSLVAS